MTVEQKYKMLILYRLKCPYNGLVMHKHHVVPKCMKPKKNALVQLSLEEHTVAHYWFWKIICKRKIKSYEDYMYAAFNGLRSQWFTSRYKCTKEKEWNKFEAKFVHNLKISYI